MIIGIGVDSVEVARFAHWNLFSAKQLHRIFSDEEIEYCLSHPLLYAERFAVRFAAREAFFKALSPLMSSSNVIPFLTLCKAVSVKKDDNGRPTLHVEWESLSHFVTVDYKNLVCHLSLTHTESVATAFIIIEKI
jgi:holo-[acyl-carrier protein] synthase